MVEKIKLNPESVIVDKHPSFMAGTSDEITQVDIAKMKSPLKNASTPVTVSATTSEGKPFKAEGYASDASGAKTAQITSYKVGNMDYKLSEPLEVKLEGRKLHKDSLGNFEDLLSKGSTSTGSFFSKKTIKSQYVPDKTSSLEQSDNMKTAVAQASKADAGFQTSFNTVPNKQPNNKIGLS